jgi:hypothetical protein
MGSLPHLGRGEIPEGSHRAICVASSTYQEEEHVKDPRRLWGLSDTCPREKETSALFQQDVKSITHNHTRAALIIRAAPHSYREQEPS